MKIPIINASQLGKRADPELDKAIGDAAYACGFLILTDLPNFKPSKLADQITAIYSLPAGEQDKLQKKNFNAENENQYSCLLYTSPSPRDGLLSRMPSSA